mgnify:FL=1
MSRLRCSLIKISYFSKDPEDPPKSFCIVRISSKAPCIVIRIAFLGGTPGKERHEVFGLNTITVVTQVKKF